MKGMPAVAKEKKSNRAVEPCENSLPLRLVAVSMALLCISVGVFFVNTSWIMIILYYWGLASGGYLSYVYRNQKTKWQSPLIYLGVIVVGINCWNELASQLEVGNFTFLKPIVHFVAGTMVMQTFEMRTRSDIYSTALVGVVLLCLISPVGKSLIFAGCILSYVILGALLFYYDSLSRSTDSESTSEVVEARLFADSSRKSTTTYGNASFAIASLPVAAIILFFTMPRADALLDSAMAYLRTLGSKSNGPIQMVPKPANQKPLNGKPPKPKQIQPPKNNLGSAKTSTPTPRNPRKVDSKKFLPRNQQVSTTAIQKERPSPKNKKDKTGKQKLPDKNGNPTKSFDHNGNLGKKPGGDGTKSSLESESDVPDDSFMSIQKPMGRSNDLLLTVKSTRTSYCRLYAFDKFDGKVWTRTSLKSTSLKKSDHNEFHLESQDSLRLPGNFAAVEMPQEYTVMRDSSRNIAVAWIPKSLSINQPTVNVDDYGSVRLNRGTMTKGTTYKVTSQFPIYDFKAMRNEQPLTMGDEYEYRSLMPQFLQLPEDIPATTTDLSKRIAGAGTSWFNQTERLTQYLRTNYIYDLTKQPSDNPLEDFLFKRKRGDCKDFATALAIMARCTGIPSRVIAGYGPGDFNSLSGVREIRARSRHAWTEIYIPNHGWMPFDATPDGYLPAKAKEKSYDMVGIQESMEKNRQSNNDNTQSTVRKRRIITPLDIFTWTIDIAAFALSAFFLMRFIRRSIENYKRNIKQMHPARKYMLLVEKDLKQLKIARAPSDTKVDLEEKVRAAIKERQRLGLSTDVELPSMVDQFMEHYYAAYFGNKECCEELEELSAKIHSITSSKRQ